MDLIFDYTQKKLTDKGKCYENYDIKIYHSGDTLSMDILYEYTYRRPKEESDDEFTLTREVEYGHTFSFDLIKGDFWISKNSTTKGWFGERESNSSKGGPRRFKNDFKNLPSLTTDAFFKGCKSEGAWGVRFKNKMDSAYDLIKTIVQPRIETDYLKTKSYHRVQIDPLFDLIVDYHLDKKNIKGHDLIYLDIQEDYPKEKFLKLNDRKFIPSVLDSYGIKNKQFISSLNNNGEGMPIIIKTLNYFCKMFGDNYIDYMNKIDWHLHCYKSPPNNKVHVLKNETEKKNMVKVINRWEDEGLRVRSSLSNDGTLIRSLYTLLDLRERIEKKGIELKFTSTNDNEIDEIYEEWSGLKRYLSRGYKLKFQFPTEFVDFIQRDILIGDVVYKPLILKREEEFKIEGHIMKNCMANQFNHGSISIFISLRKGKRWVDVQYNNGVNKMCYGKANSPIPKDFVSAVDVLSKRMRKFKDVKWTKEKYDLI